MNKIELDSTINDLAVKYAAAHPLPGINGEWIAATVSIMKQLPDEIETGITKPREIRETKVLDGQEVTVTRTVQEPVMRFFDKASEMMKDKIHNMLEKAYIEKPLPNLEVKRNPNLRKWLEALKYVFPNVKDVRQAMMSAYKFLKGRENHYTQACLYLYSPKTGGTGKTFLASHIKDYIREEGGIAKSVTTLKGDYVDPKDFRANMVVLEDINTNEVSIETMNNLIDKNPMTYNIKFGPKGTFTNQADLIATSNYCPANVNTRRWGVVEYLPMHMMNHPYDEKTYRQKVRDLMECYPEHIDTTPLCTHQTPKANQDMLNYLIDHRNVRYERPTAFFCGNEKMICQCENLVADLEAQGLLKTYRTPFRQRLIVWDKLVARLEEIGGYYFTEKDEAEYDSYDTPLDFCAAEWDKLIKAMCPEDPEDPNGGKSGKEEVKGDSLKDFVDSKLTHFSDTYTVSEEKKAQYCANCVKNDGSKVGLHTTKEECRPVMMAFESDTLTLEEQEKNIKSSCWDAKVFSGNKSLHVLVRIPEQISLELSKIEELDRYSVYHRLYREVADRLFKDVSNLDFNCKSWLRKFRTPDGVRDNGKVQKAEYNETPSRLPWNEMLEYCEICQKREEEDRTFKLDSSRTGDASLKEGVVHYLETPYRKLTGNGDSDSSLYRAIVTCLACGDEKTLEEVLTKARMEHWSNNAIQAKIRSAREFLARSA